MSTSRRHFIAGHWIGGEGEPFHSTDPATGETVWRGSAATEHDVKSAVAAARAALDGVGGCAVRRTHRIAQSVCRSASRAQG